MYYAPWLAWSSLRFILHIIKVVLDSVKLGYMLHGAEGRSSGFRLAEADDDDPIVVAGVSITFMILFVILDVYCILSVYRLFRVVKEGQQVHTFTD